MKIDTVRLDFDGDEGMFTFVMNGEEKKLRFGCGDFVDTTFPDKTFYDMVMNRSGDRELRTISTGSWTMEDRFLIVADVSDTTPGSLGIVFEFYDDKLAMSMTPSGEAILSAYDGIATGTIA